MSSVKDLKKILRKAERQGFRVKDVGRRYKVYPPDKTKPMITIAKTPSDKRALENIKADLRRAGWRE